MSVRAALDANPAVWLELLRLQPGAAVVGGCSVLTDVPFPLCNSVFFPDADADVAQLLAPGVRQLWWLGMSPEPVLGRLRALGVVCDEEQMPGMVLEDLASLAPPPPGAGDLRIEVVRDAGALEDFGAVFGPGFGLTAPARASVVAAFAAYGVEGDVRHLVAYGARGRPVACASIIVRDGVCGLYDVATAADARRRGYGAQVTVAALRLGASMGAASALLHASPDGYGIYERLGFRPVAPTHVAETGTIER